MSFSGNHLWVYNPLLQLGLLSLPPPQLLVILSYLVCSRAARSVLVRPDVVRSFGLDTGCLLPYSLPVPATHPPDYLAPTTHTTPLR